MPGVIVHLQETLAEGRAEGCDNSIPLTPGQLADKFCKGVGLDAQQNRIPQAFQRRSQLLRKTTRRMIRKKIKRTIKRKKKNCR